MIQLINGDCLLELPKIENNSIDLILADLPYGTTAPTWDKIINMRLLWIEYKRIIKDNGTIALFSAQPFTTKLIASNEEGFRYCWYWIKNQGTNFFHAKRMPIRKVEEICIFGNGNYYPQISEGHAPTNSAKSCSNGKAYSGTNLRDYEGGKTTRFPTNVLEFKCVNNYKRLHSAEKPVPLLEYLINTYTLKGQIVLDNAMGSGSTGEACINTNRDFIGIEKDKSIFNIAEQRVYNHSILKGRE